MRFPAAADSLRVLVPLAGYAALTSLARFQVNPTAGAETAYLAFIAAGVLLAIGALAVRPELEAGLATLLAVTIVWVLPAGAGPRRDDSPSC